MNSIGKQGVLSGIVMVVLSSTCLAQIELDTTRSPDYLVKQVLMSPNNQVKVKNVYYRGAKQSIGAFKNTWTEQVIPEGIMLSTGNVFSAIGPNDNGKTSGITYPHPDPELRRLATGSIYDPAILEFDFIPENDSISFGYVFASEEYPEYVNKNVNDVFAFWITNKGSRYKRNLAVIGPDREPVMIDNVNDQKNAQYYVENGVWDHSNVLKWENNKELGALAYAFQFDGFTTLLHAGSRVIPGKTYHLKIAIADVGDRRYDSAVMLEAHSFKSVPSVESQSIPENPLAADLVEKFRDLPGNIKADSHSVSITLPIHFTLNSDQVSDDTSLHYLEQIAQVMIAQPGSQLYVLGHTDNSGSAAYNLDLSDRRAQTVAQFIIAKGVAAKRIRWEGKGDGEPVESNQTEAGRAANRRVEFVFTP